MSLKFIEIVEEKEEAEDPDGDWAYGDCPQLTAEEEDLRKRLNIQMFIHKKRHGHSGLFRRMLTFFLKESPKTYTTPWMRGGYPLSQLWPLLSLQSYPLTKSDCFICLYQLRLQTPKSIHLNHIRIVQYLNLSSRRQGWILRSLRTGDWQQTRLSKGSSG